MNGYSKMGVGSNLTTKSRSIDFSDLTFSPPQAHHEDTNTVQKGTNSRSLHDLKEEEEASQGERFGVILSRNCSSASQSRLGASERRSHGGAIQAVVRRAFSMRKPSSMPEGYCRIHDSTADGEEDGYGGMLHGVQQHVGSSKKKSGRFIRACKRLLGF